MTGCVAGADALTSVQGRALPGRAGGLESGVRVRLPVALKATAGICPVTVRPGSVRMRAGRYLSTYRLLAFLSTARYNAEGFRLTGG